MSNFDDSEFRTQGRSRRKAGGAGTEGASFESMEEEYLITSSEERGARSSASAESGRASRSRSTSRQRGENHSASGFGGRSGKSGNSAASKVRRIVILAIAEVIALTAIFSYAFVIKQYNKIQRPTVDTNVVRNMNLSSEEIEKQETGFWTIAVFGVDGRDASVGRGNNSDVIILVSVNRATGEIKMTSVFRDTYLGIGNGKYNKINHAYCMGGPEQALKAINEDLDLNITQYVTFNWKAVATAINILGGVDVELSKAEFYYINAYITETVQATKIGSTQLTHAGMNHLDGVQAVAYARLRYMDSDYARTERQRKIISLCFDKAKQTDVKTLTSMIGVMLEMVGTNMTWQDGLDALARINTYHIGETGGFPFARGEAMIGKKDCVVPQTLETNVVQLHAFLFGDTEYVPSENVKAMSAKISADSGMYTEGTYVGHVSTSGGYIPASKPASQAEGSAAGDGNGDSTSGSTSTGETKTEDFYEEVKEITLADGEEGVKYAIGKDGYLVYESGTDADGKPAYKYVLGSDGKRVKMAGKDSSGNTVLYYEEGEDGTVHLGGGDTTPQDGQAQVTGAPGAQVIEGLEGGPGVGGPEGTPDGRPGTPGGEKETSAGDKPASKDTTSSGGPGAKETSAPARPGDDVPETSAKAPTSPEDERDRDNGSTTGPNGAPVETLPASTEGRSENTTPGGQSSAPGGQSSSGGSTPGSQSQSDSSDGPGGGDTSATVAPFPTNQ